MSEELYELTLDCPPGERRPNDVLKMIINGMELCEDDFTVISKSFGEWVFRISPEKNSYYKSQLNKITEKIKQLYKSGYLRYAEW